jgi:hypothetical protein
MRKSRRFETRSPRAPEPAAMPVTQGRKRNPPGQSKPWKIPIQWKEAGGVPRTHIAISRSTVNVIIYIARARSFIEATLFVSRDDPDKITLFSCADNPASAKSHLLPLACPNRLLRNLAEPHLQYASTKPRCTRGFAQNSATVASGVRGGKSLSIVVNLAVNDGLML